MSSLVSPAALDEVRLDMGALLAAADALRAAAGEVATGSEEGDRSWSTMPAGFDMPGVSSAMPLMTRRSSAVAAALADSADSLHGVLDAASFEFTELKSRRAALVERIESFTSEVGSAVARHDGALPESPVVPTPWPQVEALAVENAALTHAVDSWNEHWRDWQQRLASRVRRIAGGETTAGLATDGTDVRTASLVAPIPLPGFPSTPFQFPWPWLGAAGGAAAGTGSAAVGLSALGLLGILFGLSGDTKQQTPAEAMRQRMAQADQDAWAWTHDPLTGRPRAVAGGTGIVTDVIGPMTGPQADEEIRSLGRPGDSSPHREVDTPEEVVQAWRDISRGGKVAADSTPDRIAVVLPDGTRVQYRRDSRSGGPVVEVQRHGAKPVKLHMPKGADAHDLPDDAKPEGLD